MILALEILFGIAATVFSVVTLQALICLRHVKRLPKMEGAEGLPKVSIIFAARDEAERVETTIRKLLAQTGVDIEIIPVDDRSRDATSQIFKKFSAEDARVRPKRVDVLPPDWLGKCHACHLGAQSATGDWLLFTDADCWLKPDVLARALTVAKRENVQHITLTPGVAPSTVFAQAWHLTFLMSVADWIARVNTDHPRGYLGTGAFNLVERETYRKCGGHEALRLTVVEDVKLGKLIRRSGGRTRAFLGGDDVECHWGVTVRQMVRIMEKNYFAAIDYRTWLAVGVGPICLVFWAGAIAGFFSGSFLGTTAGVALLSAILPTAIIARKLGWKMRGALLAPFVLAALFYAMMRSTFVTLRAGGVKWRDTFYPLDKLRAGNVN
jgi:glycosyltransferase involved in cell wall biosynthesis